MLKNYFRIAWRNIARNKLYTCINVLGLTLGICVCLAIYTITSFELGFDSFHPDKGRIYRLLAKTTESAGDTHFSNNIPPPAPKAARALIPGLQNVAPFIQYPAKIRISAGTGPSTVFDNKIPGTWTKSSIFADPQYFAILNYDWLAGNPIASLSRPSQLVLTAGKARQLFGSIPFDQMLGRQVIFNDTLPLILSGIVKDWNKATDFPFTEFISFSTIDNTPLKNSFALNEWGDEHTGSSAEEALVKLQPGVTAVLVNSQLTALALKSMKIDSGTNFSLSLQRLSDVHFNADIYDGRRKAHLPTLYGLIAIAVFILLVAAVNFINLATAQSIQRAKEIGIRKVLGSGRTSLVFQFLAETSILTFFALCIAAVLVKPVLSAFHAFVPDGAGFHFFAPSTLLLLVLLGVLTALLAGLYPAKILSSYQPAMVLKGAGVQKGGEKWYLRKALIVFQFTVSLLFIIGTIVVSTQINYIRNKDLGFNSNAIVFIDTQNDSVSKLSVFAQQIRHLPGVNGVTLQSFTPLTPIGTGLSLDYNGKTYNTVLQVGDENFIPLYQLKLLAGENFRHSDSIRELIINEACARQLGFQDPQEAIGKFLSIAGSHPVVGVVADFHEKSLHEPIRPIVFLNFRDGERSIAIKLASEGKKISHVQTVLGQIEKQWKTIYPGQPFVYRFLDESIAAMYEKERKTSILMNTAMAVMIFISCMGLLGLSTFSAEQRTREIGIRKVLGAGVLNIVALLSRDFLTLVGIALVIASPIAWYGMNQWLQNFAYRIDISWQIFALAGLSALFIALITVSFRAVKAALGNPAKILRTN
jgi:putative ABC transport system permease protein